MLDVAFTLYTCENHVNTTDTNTRIIQPIKSNKRSTNDGCVRRWRTMLGDPPLAG